ncbi:MAG: anaerobic ribonucleoside-triphosphate reductase [Clostridium sp.]|uniref:anaerobic ribonucleoside-triphosphate reductase n=1 Tax=Clostridium sp. TaxID=1506 RepID=UPI003EE5E8F0
MTENVKVIKRDGSIVDFDKTKIENAILKAMKDVGENGKYKIAAVISDKISSDNKEIMQIEEIQDIVEKKLMEYRLYDVAKSYITYRYERAKDRDFSRFLDDKVRSILDCSNITNDNANVDQYSFSGRESRVGEEVNKAYARKNMVRKEVLSAFDNNYIYLHDFSKLPMGLHNCLFSDVGKLLRDGFETRNGGVRGARSIRSAMQNVAVIFQVQSQTQFGGVGSCCIDFELAPFVKYSLAKHLQKGFIHFEWATKEQAKEIVGDKIGIEEGLKLTEKYPRIWKYAMDMLEEEGQQHAEALYHNLNTLESRAGSQVPFTSINFGRDISNEGRLVSKWLLNASLKGVGKQNKTSIFPIAIFQRKKGINDKPGTPNYDLYELAKKSLANRIYPNIVNCDWSMNEEVEGNPYTYMSTMGCRTLIGYNRFTNDYDKRGRGNIVPTTMVLPRIALDSIDKEGKVNIKKFWEKLDETLDVTSISLIDRFTQICGQNPKSGSFMYTNGTIKDYDKVDNNVYEAMKHGTLAFGYIGIAEMCKVLFGKYHNEDKEVHQFALKVVEKIYNYSQEFGNKYNVNASTYCTPAESACFTIMKKLQRDFGTIEGVTDREFLTNSHHIPVFEKVTIAEKLQLEAQFCKYATGGCITYIELDSTFVKNIDAIDGIIEYAMDLDIPYLAINFPIDTCLECGFTGEIEDVCPSCNKDNIERLRRVTGYLTTDYRNFNKGKQEEVKMRYKHNTKR